MDVGVQMVFASAGWEGITDSQVWDEELRLARLAELRADAYAVNAEGRGIALPAPPAELPAPLGGPFSDLTP